MILPAQSIRRLCIPNPAIPSSSQRPPMISPFSERTRFNGVTHGLGPAGYDIRLADSIELFSPLAGWGFRSVALVDALESFDIPRDVMGFLFTKSTWARSHIAIANTVMDPGWSGHLRLEIMNHGTDAIRIAAGTGIAHVVFHRLEWPTDQPYEGKYQNQRCGQDAIFEERVAVIE